MKQKSMLSKYLKITIFFVCTLLLLFIIPFFAPMLTQLFAGNIIIDNHIRDVYIYHNLNGHINNSFEWLNNTYYPLKKDKILPLYGVGNGVYYSNNKLKLFVRPITTSWFILTKIGKCGEYADYFMIIFDELGYDVRKVIPAGGDHAIVQIVKNDTYYFVDPSSTRILNHSNYFENSQWGRIIAITMNGTRLDLTEEIVHNKTKVTLKRNTTQKVKIVLKSTYLMSNSGMYKKPLLVYKFKSQNDSIIISSGEKYLIETYRNFGLFKFSVERNIDLRNNTIIFSNDVPISFKNFKITTISYIILLVFCLIYIYFNIKSLIKKFKELF